MPVIDVAKLKREHAAFLRQHQAMIEAELGRAAESGRRFAADHAGFEDVTGKTRAGIEGKVIRTRRGHLMRLTHKQPGKGVPLYLEDGTKAHKIRARRSPLLHFYWPKIGGWFSGKSVNHPGTKPYRFIYRGYLHAEERAIYHLRSGMSLISRRFGS